MSTSQVQSDHLRYVKWLIIGSAGLFICHYIYKNSTKFFNTSTETDNESLYTINKRPKDDISEDEKVEQNQQEQEYKNEEKKDEDQPSTIIYVGNLNPKLQEQELNDFFEVCGNIKSVKIEGLMNATNPKSPKYGFVEFEKVSAAQDAYGLSGHFLKGVAIKIGADKTAVLPQKNESDEPKFPVQVYVRMRPLVGKEISDKHEAVKYNVKTNKKKSTKSLVLEKVFGRNNERDKKFTNFTNVILPNNDNEATFNICLKPALSNIFNGEKTCIFAYGHTGSGKTHTIFGYSKENVPGMYQLFARNILNDPRIKKHDDISIEVRFCELYQQKVHDLLSKDKSECFIRENDEGVIMIRAKPVVYEGGIVKAHPITGKHIQNEDELLKVIADGIGSRQVGNSTLHDKSSRSHAFLEFEIVSTELIKLREEIVDKEAEILKRELLAGVLMHPKWADQKYLDICKDEGLTMADLDRMEAEKKQYQQELKVMQENMNKLLSGDGDRKFIGGTMVFVDLAGNEYGRDVKNKDLQEEKERNEINKSLLSLKECIRAIHSEKDYVGYRSSKLTMYLRPYLNGKDSKAIMISNIGSSQQYAKQSINTLQYSQLVAKA